MKAVIFASSTGVMMGARSSAIPNVTLVARMMAGHPLESLWWVSQVNRELGEDWVGDPLLGQPCEEL